MGGSAGDFHGGLSHAKARCDGRDSSCHCRLLRRGGRVGRRHAGEGSAGVVRLRPYGANGRLRWRELQIHGRVMPRGQTGEDWVEFTVPLRPAGVQR